MNKELPKHVRQTVSLLCYELMFLPITTKYKHILEKKIERDITRFKLDR